MPLQYVKEYVVSTADDDGAAAAQTPADAGPITLTSSTVTFPNGGQTLSVTAAADEALLTFTATGTGRNGRPLTYSSTLPNADTVLYPVDFATLTEFSVSGATSGNISVGWGAQVQGDPLPLDLYYNPTNVSLTCVVEDGSPTYSVQFTNNNVQDPDIDPVDYTWFQHPTLTDKTVSFTGNFDRPVVACRMVVEDAGTVNFTVRQAQGL